MPAPAPVDWSTIAEAAEKLGVSTRTIRRMIARGDLAAKRIGPRLIRIPNTALDAVGSSLVWDGGARA